MTTTPQEPAKEPRKGYVLRDGPLDGVVAAHAERPAFIHLEHVNGGGDVYRPSGRPDAEHPDAERYDFAEAASDYDPPGPTDTADREQAGAAGVGGKLAPGIRIRRAAVQTSRQ